MSKQSPGVAGATTAIGESPFRPNITWRRSDCSFLVGIPVDGPARWTSMIDERQLDHHGEVHRLALEGDPGAGLVPVIPSAPP